MEMSISTKFWTRKRVLLTGHTGFKGAWLALWLKRLGADVIGISLAPTTTPNLFSLSDISHTIESYFCDIRDAEKLNNLIQQCQPDVIFHLAAQALVRESYANPLATFSSNIMGTANILDSLRGCETTRVVVMVTTDKVYHNNEWAWPYRETDPLGGHDPYSASKAASEIVISSYRDAFLKQQGVAIGNVRAGNVIGGGDWSDNRLIPDIVKAWQSKKQLEVRRPDAIRPWQHVLEPLSAYIKLAEKLWSNPTLAGSYNFGPNSHEAATVKTVVELVRQIISIGKVEYDHGNEGPYEAGLLTLDISKAASKLNIRPRWDLEDAVKHTALWYQAYYEGSSAKTLCEFDINAFEAKK